MGKSESQELVGTLDPGSVDPASRHEEAVREDASEGGARRKLELYSASESCQRAGRTGAPFVPIEEKTRGSHDERCRPLAPIEVVASFTPKLLKDGEAQQVRRIVTGKFVGAADVPGVRRAVSGAQADAETAAENARVLAVVGTHPARRGDDFARDGEAVLEGFSIRGPGRFGTGRSDRPEPNENKYHDGKRVPWISPGFSVRQERDHRRCTIWRRVVLTLARALV